MKNPDERPQKHNLAFVLIVGFWAILDLTFWAIAVWNPISYERIRDFIIGNLVAFVLTIIILRCKSRPSKCP
jgi:hypothetical protein